MSFFSPSQYEPQVRQKGFQLPSPGPDSTSPPPQTQHDLFAVGMNHHSYIADPFRKFPAADSATAALDFGDELFIDRPGSASQHPGSRQAAATAYDDSYHRPHNIFDISAPTPAHQQQGQNQPPLASSASSTASAFPHDPPPGFNSTLPALNSSMRYEPHPDPPQPQQSHPPSSFPSNHFTRHTPSPIHHPHHATSRSRSRSRPPSSGGVSGGPGPARTTRTRRNNSVSSTSPPPHGARPQAIVIPGTHTHHRMAASLGGAIPGGAVSSPLNGSQGWFMNSHSSASDFSLPTPDSLHSHAHPLHQHSHSHSHSHQGYTPFSLNSPTDMHLPPLSHSLSHGHGIPLGGAGSVPKDPPHGHLSLSSSIGSNGTIVNGINGLRLGMSPPHSHAVVGTPQGGQGVGVVAQAQTAAEKQAALANEKRRRRRESHNAVERRRRDNINEKISELATLIPECMLDVSNAHTTPSLDDQLLSPVSPVDVVPGLKKEEDGSTPSATAEGSVVKANKGMILRKSVEYIRYLQQLVTAQGSRNRELEQELQAYRSGNPPSHHNSDGGASASPEASTGAMNGDTIPGDAHDMVLASEASLAHGHGHGHGHGPTGFGITLPPTNEEEDEIMDGTQGHEHADSEGSLSPAASGASAEGDLNGLGGGAGGLGLHEERGRTRDVVGGRRGLNGNIGEGIMNMNVGMVAMET
ncbi:HLH-domain-containing protein [Macrolepiota fuliginosa MF-IS2]|uniref:HLH-domain-containing protein n=1 Tax=Macrolepiota fuliginosa MF-IS2 TaxID=1400762 RepID=A0A9P6C364_9AGAR|nr:HLH-domain-containing protein [Macrolepiota fuliginosa MF-IS2]